MNNEVSSVKPGRTAFTGNCRLYLVLKLELKFMGTGGFVTLNEKKDIEFNEEFIKALIIVVTLSCMVACLLVRKCIRS